MTIRTAIDGMHTITREGRDIDIPYRVATTGLVWLDLRVWVEDQHSPEQGGYASDLEDEIPCPWERADLRDMISRMVHGD